MSLLFALLAFSAVPAWAIPPEGLEAFGILGRNQGASKLMYAQGGYVHPSWTDDYELFQSYTTLPTSHSNYLTVGADVSTGGQFDDRDAYFGRYDWTFWGTQSVSIKLAHQDLRYIPAGKNIVSIDYNAAFNIGRAADFYVLAGAYYRFNLNSWDNAMWSPVNFNTDDRDAFLEFCFGSKIVMGQGGSFMTVDLNNRDPFLAYNGDNIALDFTLNFAMGRDFYWRIIESTRFSGLLAGTADLGEEQILAGFMFSY